MSRSLEELARDEFLAEAESLAQLVAHPAWPRYEALLAKMRLDVLELTATARNPRNVSRYQGAAAALREIMERPAQIVEAAKNIVEEEKHARSSKRTALDLVTRVSAEDDL